MENIIVSITGASGVVYGQRLLQILCNKAYKIHLVISEAAAFVIAYELGINLGHNHPNITEFLGYTTKNIIYYKNSDISATIASSRHPVKAMAIVPCSMNTLCSISHGIANNLTQRAASITLKEGRKLIIVPRETPLSSIHLESMLKLSNIGACILPAMPGFYHKPNTLEDQIDFVVGKILDALEIKHTLIPQWNGTQV
ncbi:MAG: UbiX family flavin prenyltransferase [Candidatus Brocadiaceae bacterium]|nr:UbiX family flavin prenyltransferase [Candidatus Brocadiaceae bacterium]